MAFAAASLHQENIYFEAHLTESDAIKDFKLVELLASRQGNSVVYCATSNAVEYAHQFLSERRIESLRYHPRMRVADRKKSLEQFAADTNSVLLAAGPLPPEASSSRIRLMIHYNFPASLSNYIQETSSVGVDGLPARCILLYLRKDKRMQKRDEEETRQVTVYAQSSMCRTKLLSRYAGSTSGDERCNRCDNCLKTPKSMRPEEKKRIDLDAILESVM